MTDLVPYTDPTSEVELPESPIPTWVIVKAEPVMVAGRSHRNNKRMLNLVLEHRKDNRDVVTVEVYVDASWKLSNLEPFLLAAENLPDGIRIKVYVQERVWWARDPDRRP